MTAEIIERLTRQMFDADTHYGSDRRGWMVGDVATEDLRLVISELTRLREENTTLTRERDEARDIARVYADMWPFGEDEDVDDRLRQRLCAATLSRQSIEGGEARP